MKKTYLLAAAAAILAGCMPQEPEMWLSATSDYDGKWSFGTNTNFGLKTSLKDNVTDGMYIQTFNTAANVPNQIWVTINRMIPSDYGSYPLKAKLTLTGTPAAFSSSEAANVNNGSHIEMYNPDSAKYGTLRYEDTDSVEGAQTWPFYGINDDESIALITAANQEQWAIHWYARATLKQGSILPKAATSAGGNTGIDSISLTFTLHSDKITYISYQKDDGTFAWKLKADAPPAAAQDDSDAGDWAADEEWTFAGYRHTGFPEDVHPE